MNTKVDYLRLAALLSLLVWESWIIARPLGHPLQDLTRGYYADHMSHMNATRRFPSVGLDLWRQAAGDLYRPLSEDEIAGLPEDVGRYCREKPPCFSVDGWPQDKPLTEGWSAVGRPYPPGHLLLMAPVAALYQFTGISFTQANWLLMLWLVALAHLALLAAWRRAAELAQGGASPLVMGFLAYSVLVHWALEGFYDAAAVFPLLLCAGFLGTQRWLAAIVAYCAAAFLHYRAFLYAPWVLWAAWSLWKERGWTRFERWDWGAVAAAVVMGVSSLVTFALCFKWLRLFPLMNNNISLALDTPDVPAVLQFLVASAVLLAAFVWQRAWMEAVLVVWMGFTLMQGRQAYPWYSQFLLPWLVAPFFAAKPRREAWALDLRLLYYLLVSIHAFRELPWPAWLSKLANW